MNVQYKIYDVSNQKRKGLDNLSMDDVETWLIKNKYNLFGWNICTGIESWSADYFLRYKTTLPL